MPAAPPPRRLLTPADADWPEGLFDLKKPPEQLHVAGRIPPLEPGVAVVGTRRADPEGLDFAYQLARDLALDGAVVVSGGALGIDRAAHEGALDAGGSTVAVLASGLAPPYPRAHGPLFDRIARAGGAVLSELPDGTRPLPGRFLDRNRVVAALVAAVVVVQAPARSGALNTAQWARGLKKSVFAVPSVPWDPRGAGCIRLLEGGARVCTRARDVLSVAASGAGRDDPPGSGVPENKRDYSDLDADGQRVMEAIGHRARTVDEIVQRAAIPADRVQRALLSLLLGGRVDERGVGRYGPCRSRRPH